MPPANVPSEERGCSWSRLCLECDACNRSLSLTFQVVPFRNCFSLFYVLFVCLFFLSNPTKLTQVRDITHTHALKYCSGFSAVRPLTFKKKNKTHTHASHCFLFLVPCEHDYDCLCPLRCSVCCDHLTNWYYEKDGKLYCRKHYWEKFGEHCHGCSLLMTGPAMVSPIFFFLMRTRNKSTSSWPPVIKRKLCNFHSSAFRPCVGLLWPGDNTFRSLIRASWKNATFWQKVWI